MKNKCGRCGAISYGDGNICPKCHDPRYLQPVAPDHVYTVEIHVYTVEIWKAPGKSEDMVARELGATLDHGLQESRNLMAFRIRARETVGPLSGKE